MLPLKLSLAIAQFTAETPCHDLTRAAAELSSQYRAKGRGRPQLTGAHRAAYLRTRLPATYAAISRVFREAKLRLPQLRIENVLDLGAGPGTAMWAAAEEFPNLTQVKLIEDSDEWVEIGRRLAAHSTSAAVRSADWQQGSIIGEMSVETYDLVVMSYVMNELPTIERFRAALAAWERTKNLLAVIEPGTPEGFANIRSIRRGLISRQAHLAAPCPHENECPMAAADWCHFSERLERTSKHRSAKGGDLGYEDEKYSYVIFARQPIALPTARVLRHPRKHSGHIEIELCAVEGLKRETLSRKHGQRYQAAKKADWGETL